MLGHRLQRDDQHRRLTSDMIGRLQELEATACQIDDQLASFKDRPRRSVAGFEQGFGDSRDRTDTDSEIGRQAAYDRNGK